MKYPFTLLFSLVIIFIAIIDYAFDRYNSLSMIIVILSGMIIFCMRREIIELEDDAEVSRGEK